MLRASCGAEDRDHVITAEDQPPLHTNWSRLRGRDLNRAVGDSRGSHELQAETSLLVSPSWAHARLLLRDGVIHLADLRLSGLSYCTRVYVRFAPSRVTTVSVLPLTDPELSETFNSMSSVKVTPVFARSKDADPE